MQVKARLEAFINGQYRQPTGLVGRFIGERMARQHYPENVWTVSLLDVQPADRILEVGSGPGVALEMLVAQAVQGLVVGVDISSTMLAVAKRRNIQAVRAGRVELKYGVITALPMADASCDKVLTVHTIYFWTDPIKTLVELRRVLKPGGLLVLTFMPQERWPDADLAETIAGVYTGQDVVKLVYEAGFAQAHIDMGPEHKQFREIAVIATK